MLHLWWLLRELNTELPYNPAILLLGICPRKMKISVPRKTSRKMFTEHHSLARSGNNPNVNQLMSGSIKIWYVYTLEYYSVIKGQKVPTWTNFENMMLSKRHQTQVHTLLGLHLHKMSRMGGDVETESRAAVARGQGWGRFMRGTDKGRRICWNYIEVLVAWHCDELSIIESHALKWLVLCEFHLNQKKIFLKKRWRGHRIHVF